MPRLTPELVRERLAAGTLEFCAGNGNAAEGTCCFVEAESLYLGRERMTDQDQDRPILAAFCRRLNDRLRHDERQRLAPYVARVVESPVETPSITRARVFLLADDACRRAAPSAFESRARIADIHKDAGRAATLRKHADAMRSTLPVTDRASAQGARAICNSAAAAAAAAADAADAAAAYAYADAARKPDVDAALALLDRLLLVVA